ncbi:MAG: hypothetical protein OEZ14_00385 [Acidimicrobiia bacterium]|nr:hypothetical protein [Acidimicrobiia bacterium]
MNETRLAALNAAKLNALVTSVTGGPCDQLVQPGLSLTCGRVGDRLFALADRLADLGPILAWAEGNGGPSLTVFADDSDDLAGHLARRSSLLSADITVMRVVGAKATPAEPVALPLPPDLGEDLWRAAAVMADAGARVVDDHGRLTGEVLGLEVARVEPPGPDDDEITVRVGVGRADRDLQGYVLGHLDDVARLRRSVGLVETHRRAGVALHPLNRLSRPRWLRSVLLDDPAIVNVVDLDPLPPLWPDGGLLDTEPSAAFSPSDRVTVVCSAGFDFDLLPQAVDYRHRIDPGSSLTLVVPRRDRELVERRVTGAAPDVSVRSVDTPWG